MALDEYQRKRDFSKSPEPKGDADKSRTARKGKPLFFCVQKHLASQLHYDFRLEHHGVLLSWAVPKGPSLDPSVKRLAMHVEDHPVEYGTFEGVIPEGYGAGVVMLWDQGTWTPEVDDVEAALVKGDLKLTLDGFKLKGSWALVRTRGWGGKNRSASTDTSRSWLLIKHRDEWAGDLDIATFAPLSVKTNMDLHEILAQDQPATWQTNRPGTGEANAMMREIIEKAAALRAGRDVPAARPTTATLASAAPKAAKPKASAAKAAPAKTHKSKAPAARTPRLKTGRASGPRKKSRTSKPSR